MKKFEIYRSKIYKDCRLNEVKNPGISEILAFTFEFQLVCVLSQIIFGFKRACKGNVSV